MNDEILYADVDKKVWFAKAKEQIQNEKYAELEARITLLEERIKKLEDIK